MVQVRDVAAELRRRIPGIGTTKLHKLLYYCQGHHLATTGEPLFTESVSAWNMGPVVGSLWYEEKQQAKSPSAAVPDVRPLADEGRLNTIGYVVSRYGRLSGTDLVHLTHSEEPWRRADEGRAPDGHVRIRNEWLRAYFVTDAAGDDDVGDVNAEEVSAWLQEAGVRVQDDLRPDDLEELRRSLRDAS